MVSTLLSPMVSVLLNIGLWSLQCFATFVLKVISLGQVVSGIVISQLYELKLSLSLTPFKQVLLRLPGVEQIAFVPLFSHVYEASLQGEKSHG
jgi:hypothetical protein